MASVVGKQAASDVLGLQPRRKTPTRSHQVEGLDRLWLNLEKQIARIPLDRDGSTLEDQDEVQTSQQLLAMDDGPFDYCLKGFYDADEFPKWISRRQSIQARVKTLQILFCKWIVAFPASEMEHWCKLPAMLRYALKRPLMPQRDLENKLKELGFRLPTVYSRMMMASSKALNSREQNLLLGIDIDGSSPHQPRAQSHDLIDNGWLRPDQNIDIPKARTSEDTRPGSDGVEDRKASDEEDLERQLKATYALFQKGKSDISEAIDRYKYFLAAPNISNSDLAWRLEDFGIPKEHIIGLKTEPEPAALHQSLQQTCKLLHDGQISFESAISRYRYLLDQPTEPLSILAYRLEDLGLPREHIFGRVCEEDSSLSHSPTEDYELEIVEEVKTLVVAYRSGHLKLDEAVSFTSKRLEGLRIDQPFFTRLISSGNLTPAQAAQAIFESAAEESQSPNSMPQTNPGQTKNLELMTERFLELYAERIADGLDPRIALAEYREEFDLDDSDDFQPHEVSFILAQLQSANDSIQEVSGMTTGSETENAIDKNSGFLIPSRPPPKMRMSREHSPSLGSETLARSEHPGDSSIATLCDDSAAQEPILAVAQWEQSYSGTAGNPEHRDYDVLSSSPEHGLSTDLWGLELPTAKAKKLALDIGLPTDYVNRRIRSLTPVRITSTKARKRGFSMRSPPTKRKASPTAHQGRRIRSPQFNVDPAMSAKEVNTYDAGASTSCASERSSSFLGSVINSIEEVGPKCPYQDAPRIDEYPKMSGARGTVDESEIEMKRLTSVAIDKNQDPSKEPDTILEYFKLNVLENGIFRVDLPTDSKSYMAAIRTIASGKKAEIATKIKSGLVRPTQSDTERQLIILLRDIEREPNSLKVCSLTAFIQRGLRELAELADLGVLTNELSTKAGQGTSASLSPSASSASSNPKADTPSMFMGILASNPCPHNPPSRGIDLCKLYSGKARLLRDAGFVKQLFVCPECSKSNGNEPLSFIEPMKRPQRLHLTKPQKRLRVICHDDDVVPFIGTPKDMSYSAAVNCQSFFVGLETRRRQRRKANLSAINDRYFQNPISSPSSSGSTSQLNKLFERYKGTAPPTKSIVPQGLTRSR